jgi:hypothetical protein
MMITPLFGLIGLALLSYFFIAFCYKIVEISLYSDVALMEKSLANRRAFLLQHDESNLNLSIKALKQELVISTESRYDLLRYIETIEPRHDNIVIDHYRL